MEVPKSWYPTTDRSLPQLSLVSSPKHDRTSNIGRQVRNIVNQMERQNLL